MRRPRTLRGRLAVVAAATTAIWVGLATLAFNLLLAAQLNAQSGSLLRDKAEAGAATVVVQPDGSVHVTEPTDDEALESDLWIYSGSTALERPHAGRQLQQRADALAGGGERFEQTSSPDEVRMFALPVRRGQHQVATVVVAVSLDPYRNVARVALIGSTGFAVLLLAGVYTVTLLLVRRALAPVQHMSTQAARWSESDAVERFGVADRPGELALLAANLDGVLDRQGALLRHEQQVTEELSHELRTPLSLITAETDLLRTRRRSPAQINSAVQRIADGAAHMSRILETLLSAARSRSAGTTGRCLLLPVVRQSLQRLPEGGAQAEVTEETAGLGAAVDGELVDRMLAPLLDNARRYARSRIDVTITSRGQLAVVRVADDGPGVQPELLDALFDPGRRDPETSPHGAGLGLALARRLARAAAGDLVVSADGFELTLPRV